MRNFKIGFLTLLLIAGTLSKAAFAFHNDEVNQAAIELAHTAEHFNQVSRGLTGYSHLTQDVQRLAATSHHFAQVVAAGADYAHAGHDFQAVQASFNHLSHLFAQAHAAHHNWHVIRDWESVQYAFEDLTYAMQP